MLVIPRGGLIGLFTVARIVRKVEMMMAERGDIIAQNSDSGPIACTFSERCSPSSESTPMREQRSLSNHFIIS